MRKLAVWPKNLNSQAGAKTIHPAELYVIIIVGDAETRVQRTTVVWVRRILRRRKVLDRQSMGTSRRWPIITVSTLHGGSWIHRGAKPRVSTGMLRFRYSSAWKSDVCCHYCLGTKPMENYRSSPQKTSDEIRRP